MRPIVATLVLMLLSGCIAPQNSVVRDVDSCEWSEPVTLVVDNDDTLSMRRLSFVIRYNADFRADVVGLKVNVIQPDAASFSESVSVYPLHTSSTSSVSTVETITYRESSVLRQRGSYLFTITPLHPVCGIEAIGINIENQ
ncbi:MAG: hypothetical protein ACI35T_06925 [Alistipes sp.]